MLVPFLPIKTANFLGFQSPMATTKEEEMGANIIIMLDTIIPNQANRLTSCKTSCAVTALMMFFLLLSWISPPTSSSSSM